MSVTTQIRRSLMSVVVLAAFGLVASTQGEAVSSPADAFAAVAACPSDAPAADATPRTVEAKIDWRARLPATIARSRS
jgi:hypothetical protein